MASVGGGSGSNFQSPLEPGQNYRVPLILMFCLYFMIGFITVMNDVLIPSLKSVFKFTDADNGKLMLIQFCFFIAYFVMSIPSGMIISKIGYKKGLAVALCVMASGLLLFLPAASLVSFPFFLFALFVVASGVTLLQVALNPYITALGSPETASSRMNLGGSLNSFATFIGPIIGGSLILNECLTTTTEKVDAVRAPYIVLSLVTFAIAIVLLMVKLPKLKMEGEASKFDFSVWKYSHLRKGAYSIFYYVGAEVAIGSLLILYLQTDEMGNIPEKLGASFLAYYWGSAMIGRFAGSFLAQKIKAEKLLVIVSTIAFSLVALSMLGVFMDHKMTVPVLQMGRDCVTQVYGIGFKNIVVPISAVLLMLVGLFNSVMWPAIFPLGINKLGTKTASGSGIMITMVVGGAVIPFVLAFLATGYKIGVDEAKNAVLLFGFKGVGFKLSFALALICYGYLVYYGKKGHKISDADAAELQQFQ